MKALVEVVREKGQEPIHVMVEVFGGDDQLWQVMDKLNSSYHNARLLWAGLVSYERTAVQILDDRRTF